MSPALPGSSTSPSRPSQPTDPALTPGVAVRTRGLTKRFGAQAAVDGIDLEVPAGAVYGFLGPNGSGKTTTIRMLLGLVHPTAGSLEVLGEPIPGRASEVLPRVGSLVEGPAFHPYLSGRANLTRLDAADRFADPATAATRIDAALDRVGLLAAARKRYRAYSLGMRQRLAIAEILVKEPQIAFLDEPTLGLDPEGTNLIIDHIQALSRESNMTILLSSHDLTQVQKIADRIGIMIHGKLIAEGPLEKLAQEKLGVEDKKISLDDVYMKYFKEVSA